MSTTIIKSAVVAAGISFTNGKLDTALSRRIAYGKLSDQPQEILKAALAKVEETLAKVRPGDTKLVITFYTPKVEIE